MDYKNDTHWSHNVSIPSHIKFETLSTISVDYILLKDLDVDFATFYLSMTIFTTLGSAVCIFLNTLLVYCIITTLEFRNWIFFPVCLQSIIDIIGPGLSNIIYTQLIHNQVCFLTLIK